MSDGISLRAESRISRNEGSERVRVSCLTGVLILRLYPRRLCTPVPRCRQSGWERLAPTMSRQAKWLRQWKERRRLDTVISIAHLCTATNRRLDMHFSRCSRSSIQREQLWITSKLWNDKHGENDVIASCKQSLADLRLDYLDLYLVHWPFPNFHPPGCDVTSRSEDAKPYIHANFMKTWRKMEELVDLGLVRHIGTSNMTIPKLKLLLRDARIKPAVNEMELHPHFQQPELFEFVRSNGMVPVGYCPIGSPGRPERDRTAEDTVAHPGSGDCQDRKSPRSASGGRLHQMGGPARAGADSVFRQPQPLPQQSGRRGRASR